MEHRTLCEYRRQQHPTVRQSTTTCGEKTRCTAIFEAAQELRALSAGAHLLRARL